MADDERRKAQAITYPHFLEYTYACLALQHVERQCSILSHPTSSQPATGKRGGDDPQSWEQVISLSEEEYERRVKAKKEWEEKVYKWVLPLADMGKLYASVSASDGWKRQREIHNDAEIHTNFFVCCCTRLGFGWSVQ